MGESVNANDLVAFVVEVIVFVSLGVWAWRRGTHVVTSGLAVVAVVGTAAVLWGVFVSPQAPVDLLAADVGFRALILTAGLAALATLVSRPVVATAAVVTAVSSVLIYVGPFSR